MSYSSVTLVDAGDVVLRSVILAQLMRRGLNIDSLACPRGCGLGRLRFVAVIDQPAVIRRILHHLGLPAAPVRPAPARAPPELDELDELDWGA